nr:acyltransferase [Variovorax paradoxus]
MFWSESGYFDTAAETKPLLHLWSLGIEEQFYIFWPLLLGLAWRKRWPMVRVVLAVAAVSFLINVTTVHPLPAASFYSPASRFWELMVGGILACMRLKPPAPNAWRSHVQSVLGVGLIVLGLVMIRSNKAFPGWWALLPTLGAVSCIAAGRTAC